ncbi:hypothetical protein PIB30_057082 [Stylosanthes scabra]|uniref:Secreted protein n=1 Tax=Stylosanthes scabra TaxID=79078 RepID=A0ABU6TJD4_9FABA|nr:hypothetical protein [Stylosanthes scabra]
MMVTVLSGEAIAAAVVLSGACRNWRRRYESRCAFHQRRHQSSLPEQAKPPSSLLHKSSSFASFTHEPSLVLVLFSFQRADAASLVWCHFQFLQITRISTFNLAFQWLSSVPKGSSCE